MNQDQFIRTMQRSTNDMIKGDIRPSMTMIQTISKSINLMCTQIEVTVLETYKQVVEWVHRIENLDESYEQFPGFENFF